MSRRVANKRVPISCENCRKRKIACSGGQAPCHTCTRRGFASTCHFLKESGVQPRTPESISRSEQDPLLNRIAALERLLQENIHSTKQSLDRSAEWSREAFPSPSSIGRPQPTTHVPTGKLVYSQTGHVRYTQVDSTGQELHLESPNNLVSPGEMQLIEFPFSARSTSTKDQILELLPPLTYCDELKNIFMEVFSPLFHILHDPRFEEDYKKFRQNSKDVSLPFLALVFVVMAIAVTALDESHHLLADLGRESTPGANARSIAARFRDAATRALAADHFLWRHNLHTLQALMLLIYALSHAHGPAWSLLGTTLNIAIAIGCHVDPSGYDVGIIEAEERRRCWAALSMLYTIQNTYMGISSPMSIAASIQPPADLDDEVLSDMQSGEGAHEQQIGRPSKMTYILHKFELYRLASEICALRVSAFWDDDSVRLLDRKIATEESIQRDKFNRLEELPTYHQAHHYILSSYTSHLYIILHRPCLTMSSESQASPNTLPATQAFSIERLYRASSNILDNHEVLHTTPAFQCYRWYTYGLGSFHAFLAATTMTMLLGKPSLSADINRPLATRQLNQCLKRFEETSNRSDLCAKAALILKQFLVPDRRPAQTHDQPDSGHTIGDENFHLRHNSNIPGNLSAEGSTYTGAAPDWFATICGEPQSQQGTNFPPLEGVDVDIDGWTADPELVNLLYQIPSQQFLSPSSFPWWKWDQIGAVPL